LITHIHQHTNAVRGGVFLGGAVDLNEMVRRIFDKLLKESIEKKWYEPVKELFGKSVDKVGLFGLNVQLKASQEDLDSLVRGFPAAMRKLTETLRADKKNGRTGVILILDDINGLADQPAFAHWLKSMIDEIAVSRDPTPLCILLVGLEDRRQALVSHNPSLARAFHLFPIAPWSREETEKFLRETLERAGATIEPNALAELAYYAGGLPVLAHELGEAALHQGKAHVTMEQSSRAIVQAAEVVGRKHLQPQVLEAIRSETYRNTLAKVARQVPVGTLHFKKADISGLTSEEARNFHNFLQRMVKLGVLVPDGDRGEYRFATYLHHIYLWMFVPTNMPVPPPS
jgi:hypothetical protein